MRNIEDYTKKELISVIANLFDNGSIAMLNKRLNKFELDNISHIGRLSVNFCVVNSNWSVPSAGKLEFTSKQGLYPDKSITCQVNYIEGNDVYGIYVSGTKMDLSIPFSLSLLRQEGNNL